MRKKTRFDLSATKLRAYKSCRRKYELSYVYGLRPETESEALTIGRQYHTLMEYLGRESPPTDISDEMWTMVRAFQMYGRSQLPFDTLDKTEVEFDVRLPGFRYGTKTFVHLVGRIDGIFPDGSLLEHKTIGSAINERYIDHLALDDQATFYLAVQYLNHKKGESYPTSIYYSVVQKPAIAKRGELKRAPDETRDAYLERLWEWYEKDTDQKVRVIKITRDFSELSVYIEELKRVSLEMRRQTLFPRNPDACAARGCEYRSICQYYDPDLTVGFISKEEAREREECKF